MELALKERDGMAAVAHYHGVMLKGGLAILVSSAIRIVVAIVLMKTD